MIQHDLNLFHFFKESNATTPKILFSRLRYLNVEHSPPVNQSLNWFVDWNIRKLQQKNT